MEQCESCEEMQVGRLEVLGNSIFVVTGSCGREGGT